MIKDRYGQEVSIEDIVRVLAEVENGATVWGLREAIILRAIDENQETHGYVELLNLKELEEILGKKFNGAKALPYFGAIATPKGKKFLEDQRRRNGEGQ